MRRLLTIAGSDSGGGAGIQADLKTFQAFGHFGMSVVTAVTAQNTEGVLGVYPVAPEAIRAQLAAVLDDLGVDAVKIGMVGDADAIAAIAATLEPLVRAGVPIVLDPVMQAKGGQSLLRDDARQSLTDKLLPLATVVTPNLPEAAALVGFPVDDEKSLRAAADTCRRLGARWALIKGGHGDEPIVTDWLVGPSDAIAYRHVRQDTPHTHGTGCTLSSAIAAGLAQGCSVPEAVGTAAAFVAEAIRTAPRLGHGRGPLNHQLFSPAPGYRTVEPAARWPGASGEDDHGV